MNKGCLPSNGEVEYDPDIPFSLEEHFSTPIKASQSTLPSLTPMDDSQRCLHLEILYRMDQLLAVYLTEGILYINDILLIDIIKVYLCYIYIHCFCSVRSECSNYGFVITVIIAHDLYTLVLIFVI